MRYRVSIQIRCTKLACKYKSTKRAVLTENQLNWVRSHRSYTERCPYCKTDGSLVANEVKAKQIEPQPNSKLKPKLISGIRVADIWKYSKGARR